MLSHVVTNMISLIVNYTKNYTRITTVTAGSIEFKYWYVDSK